MPVNYQELATGKYYEELEIGKVYKHAITRTVTETDNLLFSALDDNMAGCTWTRNTPRPRCLDNGW